MTFLWAEEKEKLENKPASVGDIMWICRGNTIIKGISQTINKWYSPKADQLQYSKTGQTRVFLRAAVLRRSPDVLISTPQDRTCNKCPDKRQLAQAHTAGPSFHGLWDHDAHVFQEILPDCSTAGEMLPGMVKRKERCYQTTPRVESVLKLLKDYVSNMDEMLKS